MSRHFNYEIDERRVRLLLKENSLPFEDKEWEIYSKECKPVQSLPKLPSVSLPSFAISKSAFLTVVFIVLVGSFTWLIARFVDFSTAKSNSEIVREVKPEPENVQLLPQKPETKNTPSTTASPEPMKDSLVQVTSAAHSPSYSPAAIPDNTAGQQAETSSKPNPAETYSIPKNPGLKDSTAKTNRKRPKKQVETMEAKPITTEIPLMPQQEPELELK